MRYPGGTTNVGDGGSKAWGEATEGVRGGCGAS